MTALPIEPASTESGLTESGLTEPPRHLPPPRRYLVQTYGCQMNENDSERIAGLLEADGLEPATHIDDADVIVVNTCCIRENADNRLYSHLGDLKAQKAARPGVEIVVAGCLAQKDRERIRERAPHVDLVLGTHNVHRAVDLLHDVRRSGPTTEIWEKTVLEDHQTFPSALAVQREASYTAWLTIQMGCDNSCAFCIVPSVRGREISRPFGELVESVQRLVTEGVVEITLLGQNVNSYGRDITTRLRSEPRAGSDLYDAGPLWTTAPSRRARPLFADLLGAVAQVEGIRRIRYTSPHPKDLRPETIAAMANHAAVCPHLHLPLQSGSDGVLTTMHRGYTAERYLERLAAARAGVADLAVTTDIIVGFPGETDAQFADTLEVVAEARFDSAFTFVYSPRDGTEAAEFADRFVPASVSAERMERLRAVVERSSRHAHAARVGRIEEVIVERASKKDPNVLTGRTAQNKMVHFPVASPIRFGSFANVLVVGAGGFYLFGELQEVTAAPLHRTRIPVAVG